MTRFTSCIARFRKGERGAATIEFVINFIVMMGILSTAIELGVVTTRQTALESRLDSVMRDVRINTGAGYTHEDIASMMCEDNALFGDCEANLRLEMITTDPRLYTQLPASVSCVNHSEINESPFNFQPGQANELVIVRACMLYDPILPTSLLALSRSTAESGHSALVAVSAFTQEPI